MLTQVEEQIKPYYETSRFSVFCGDCRSVLPIFSDCYFDSIVCDPPYELGFMGKGWDRSGIAYDVNVWQECLRVLKPGGHLLAFGGSRTYHRLACAIEDAGFEIRDDIDFWYNANPIFAAFYDSLSDEQKEMLHASAGAPHLSWIYGSGFPKSLDVSKQIDLIERAAWENIKRTLEELDHGVIIEAWNSGLPNAALVDSPSLKNRVEVGFNTQRSDSVPVNAPPSINPKRLPFNAIIAEMQYCEAPPLSGVDTTSARVAVGTNTEPSQVPAVSVEQLLQNPSLKVFITASIAHSGVRASLNGSRVSSLRDEEALKIWLGKKKCLDRRDTDALCAGLIDGLKLTILNQSKTFQNLDTQSQTECVSAMTVTTTASTAASLISFTVDTLRSVATDAAAGAVGERGDYISADHAIKRRPGNERMHVGYQRPWRDDPQIEDRNARQYLPATDAAKQWNGWGTALKPAHEPIVLARKPLIGTVAENVLQHGTGGLNIDGCRVDTNGEVIEPVYAGRKGEKHGGKYGNSEDYVSKVSPLGRWPANVILSYPEDEYLLRSDVTPEQKKELFKWLYENT